MIIINQNRIADAANASVQIVETVVGFDVTISGQTIQFDKSKLDFAPDAAFIDINEFGQIVMYWQSELGGTRDAVSSLIVRKRVNPAHIAEVTILVEPNKTLHVLCQHDAYAMPATGTVVVERKASSNVSPRAIIQEHLPEMVAFSERNRIKLEAIGRFNPVDAVAGLEFQLDMLTAAVKALIAKLPEADRPTWWPEFEAAVLGNSSFGLLSENVAIARILEEKTKTRANQIDYYGKLAALNA
jgi:hypothetical protein